MCVIVHTRLASLVARHVSGAEAIYRSPVQLITLSMPKAKVVEGEYPIG